MSTCDLNSRRSIVVVASTTLSGRSAGVDAQPIAYIAQQCCPFILCLMCHRQLPQKLPYVYVCASVCVCAYVGYVGGICTLQYPNIWARLLFRRAHRAVDGSGLVVREQAVCRITLVLSCERAERASLIQISTLLIAARLVKRSKSVRESYIGEVPSYWHSRIFSTNSRSPVADLGFWRQKLVSSFPSKEFICASNYVFLFVLSLYNWIDQIAIRGAETRRYLVLSQPQDCGRGREA